MLSFDHQNQSKWHKWCHVRYNNSSDPDAMPEVTGINYSDVFAENVTMAGRMEGIPNDPYTGICISNVTAQLAPDAKELQWNCTNVKGVTSAVTPKPCPELGAEGKPCAFPEEELIIGPQIAPVYLLMVVCRMRSYRSSAIV